LPIMIFWLGTIGEQKIKQARQNKSELPSLHSGKFAPEPKTTLITGKRLTWLLSTPPFHNITDGHF